MSQYCPCNTHTLLNIHFGRSKFYNWFLNFMAIHYLCWTCFWLLAPCRRWLPTHPHWPLTTLGLAISHTDYPYLPVDPLKGLVLPIFSFSCPSHNSDPHRALYHWPRRGSISFLALSGQFLWLDLDINQLLPDLPHVNSDDRGSMVPEMSATSKLVHSSSTQK